MASVLAIISKAVFEKAAKVEGRLSGVSDVVPLDRYTSKNKGIQPVAGGGAVFLVTVRPPDEALWLVAVLEDPSFDGENWIAAPNAMPIRDISGLKDKIKFESGTGISAKKGALGMSLQTPRVLAEEDVALLRAGASGAPMSAPGAKGHLNGHERSSPTPCLCHKCLPSAPDTFTIGSLELVRRRANAKKWFVWFWMPTTLLPEEDAVRRAVESQLLSREAAAEASRKTRRYENLDKVFAGGGDE